MFRKSRGFTLIELIVVMAVVLILLSFASINLFNFPTSSSIDAAVTTLRTDINTQQIKAMAGDTEGRGVPDTFGIYFTSTTYTMFHGASYSQNDPDNFVTTLPTGYSITNTFPNSILIFNKGSGEVANFSSSQNTVTVRNTTTNKQKTMTLNKYGTIISIQ